jgi:hypothetical protein
MSELITAANEVDVLNAPIDIPSHVRDDDKAPRHIAKEVVEDISRFPKLIHQARALKEHNDSGTFTREQLEEFKEMYDSITHSLMYYL